MFVTTQEVIIDGRIYPKDSPLPVDVVTKRMIDLGMVTVKEEKECKELVEEKLEEEVVVLEELLLDDSSKIEVDKND